MHRSKMSKEERSWRSRLAQIMHSKEFIRGTLTIREHICGKANCKCSRGEKHVSLYLSCSQKGKARQIYIPANIAREVKKWTKEYREVKKLLDKISGVYWKKLKERDMN